ncbi:hypothetical protein AB1Y20_011541 [Prymnesium parvum]|uniref:Hexosyltransferase n=1 Tax=Prymnesium parvum TaxID=97485 RepID=A0AB34IIV2_PRYPA
MWGRSLQHKAAALCASLLLLLLLPLLRLRLSYSADDARTAASRPVARTLEQSLSHWPLATRSTSAELRADESYEPFLRSPPPLPPPQPARAAPPQHRDEGEEEEGEEEEAAEEEEGEEAGVTGVLVSLDAVAAEASKALAANTYTHPALAAAALLLPPPPPARRATPTPRRAADAARGAGGSKSSHRFRALRASWAPLFRQLVVFESHTNVARVQQIWKYVPQRLYAQFPRAHFYLIVDDDVFINQRLLLEYIRFLDPNAVALYGPGFCDWGVKKQLKERIKRVLPGLHIPDFIHIVIGGIMLFTAEAVRRFSDATTLMQCIDDLETLYSHKVMLWDGLKKSAMYNQDWLFCWCLQVRMRGVVYLDHTFDDVDFPAHKCPTLAAASRELVGIHHATPRRVRALWRSYGRANATPPAADPSQRAVCRLDRHGNPAAHQRRRESRAPPRAPPRASAAACDAALANASLRRAYPQCVPHVRWLRAHPQQAACYGAAGRASCDGFQIDASDTCNLQYYLFCERLFKGTVAESWCPPPEGYPEHCCFERAMADLAEGRTKPRDPHDFLMQVFPNRLVYQEEE